MSKWMMVVVLFALAPAAMAERRVWEGTDCNKFAKTKLQEAGSTADENSEEFKSWVTKCTEKKNERAENRKRQRAERRVSRGRVGNK